MTGRTVAFIEWALAAAFVIWFVIYLVLSETVFNLTLGVVVTSLFFAPGLAFSLAINGLIHFRRERLAVSEHVLLGIEALIVLLLILASVVDQLNYGPESGIISGFGHWFDWFVPLWLLLLPAAFTAFILALVKRKPRPATLPAS